MSFKTILGICAVVISISVTLLWAGAPRVNVLYRFSGPSDAGGTQGPLIADGMGNLYGTSAFGGQHGCGTVFELRSPAVRGGKWKETILYAFTGGADGAAPNPGLVRDTKGNLFGTTFDGGLCFYVCGVVFKLSPPTSVGGAWTFSVIHSFSGAGIGDGGGPSGNLILDHQGNLYGVTQQGGNIVCSDSIGPCGEVFQLSGSQQIGVGWTLNVLYTFRGVPDGQYPYGGVIFDGKGNLYGVTSEGGTGKCTDGEGLTIGCGLIFRLSPSASCWTESVLYDFTASENNMPGGPLTLGNDGALYGTASYSVFRVAAAGGAWKKQDLYIFTKGINGTIPSAPVSFDAAGNFYGTTASSGLNGFSTAFRLSPSLGQGRWTETTLAEFGTGLNSDQPRGGLVTGKFGWRYGVTSDGSLTANGFVFAIAP